MTVTRTFVAAIVAMALATGMGSSAVYARSDQASHIVTDGNCIVTNFYGIPLDLKLSGVSELNIDHTRAYYNAEGSFYPEATLLVADKILVQIEFSDGEDPRLHQLRTSSHGAAGPRGVAIGATLREVRQKWPEGSFYWANAHGPYVAFRNGTNVYFEFDPRDMPAGAFDPPPAPVQNASGGWVLPSTKELVPDPDKLKVTDIRITSGEHSDSCPNADTKE
ncbi:MAG TPA: hypothetical protein VF637_08900 [Sphingomicrobium sp.]